ncbi:hypothetical protein FSARC_4124 [Fusarium sarcochroum]|uniref:DUF7905 domain-containing protein n=1 Tax=Fusarium sarcochroum TaxID=1208366 RepID=A0A8H4XBV4_9HYPO|nr:hypothetical protein FSARC_4124 [Fusarium sarcochroum]
MEGWAEFYVSCNPPLLPDGVSLIITDLTRELGSIVVEVLYEPEVPWFKLIAAVGNQPEICRWMHSRLQQLLEAEAGPITQDQDEEDIEGPRLDIEVLTEKPKIVSYPTFHDIYKGILEEYDNFRYPGHIKHLPYKTVWRSPEASSEVTFTQLLLKYEMLWPASLSEPRIEKLGDLTNCKLSYNLRGSLVYIGSKNDEKALAALTRKLDTLASFMSAPSATASHLIFTERPGLNRICYRWLTHTGLSRLTYVDPAGSERHQEYERIAGAVSLRIETIDGQGNAVRDSTVYPIGARTSNALQTTFSPFAGYVYGTKRSGTTAVNENKRPLQCSQPQTFSVVNKAAKSTMKSRSANDNQACVSAQPKYTEGDSDTECHAAGAPNEDCGVLLDIETVEKGTSSSGLRLQENNQRCASSTQSWIRRWIDDTQLNEIAEHSGLDHYLADDKNEQYQEASTGSGTGLGGNMPHGTRQAHNTPYQIPPWSTLRVRSPQLVELEDIPSMESPSRPQTPTSACRPGSNQNLLDSDSPKNYHGLINALGPFVPKIEDSYTNQDGSQGRQKVPSSAGNLMDRFDGPINTPALLDQPLIPSRYRSSPGDRPSVKSVHPEVVFGKQQDKSKSLFETMKQKAAPGPSWASVASNKRPKKEEKKGPFGQNVRVTVVPDRTKARSPEKTESVRMSKPASQPVSKSDSLPVKQMEQGVQMNQNISQEAETNSVVKKPRVVPGMDMPAPGQTECVEIVIQAERKLHELLEILQVTPGKVSLQAKFGRLCLKNVAPSIVDIGQGPSWSVRSVAESLNNDKCHVGFYPILTTSCAEANMLTRLSGGRAQWLLARKRVYYDFLCTKDGGTPLMVRVDAETFKHECLPLSQEISQTFIHCTQRAWDVKFAITRMDTGHIPEGFEAFAASLVRSMSIETNEIGEIVIDVQPKSDSGCCVDRVNIHHQAQYRNGENGPSCLTIDMTRVVEKFPTTSKEEYRGQSVPVTPPEDGLLGQWFEASVSSIRAEELFKENAELEIGERSRWTPDALQRQGALKAVCEPALRMVSQMDQVGSSNENGHGPRTDRRAYDTIQESKERDKKVYFW